MPDSHHRRQRPGEESGQERRGWQHRNIWSSLRLHARRLYRKRVLRLTRCFHACTSALLADPGTFLVVWDCLEARAGKGVLPNGIEIMTRVGTFGAHETVSRYLELEVLREDPAVILRRNNERWLRRDQGRPDSGFSTAPDRKRDPIDRSLVPSLGL